MNKKEFVRKQLAKYKEYVQRLKIIEQERDVDDIIEGGFGYSYDGVGGSVESNGYHSDVEDKVLAIEEDDLGEEYREKAKFVRKVELALDGLGPAERFIIERKFCLVNLQGEYVNKRGTVRDVDIYNLKEFW